MDLNEGGRLEWQSWRWVAADVPRARRGVYVTTRDGWQFRLTIRVRGRDDAWHVLRLKDLIAPRSRPKQDRA
jgi:hypothetical protein